MSSARRQPLPEPGPELAARNRRIVAERLKWPDGAIDACERIERDHPGWNVYYAARPWPTLKSGYYATRLHSHRLERRLYGATANELATSISEQPGQNRD